MAFYHLNNSRFIGSTFPSYTYKLQIYLRVTFTYMQNIRTTYIIVKISIHFMINVCYKYQMNHLCTYSEFKNKIFVKV